MSFNIGVDRLLGFAAGINLIKLNLDMTFNEARRSLSTISAGIPAAVSVSGLCDDDRELHDIPEVRDFMCAVIFGMDSLFLEKVAPMGENKVIDRLGCHKEYWVSVALNLFHQGNYFPSISSDIEKVMMGQEPNNHRLHEDYKYVISVGKWFGGSLAKEWRRAGTSFSDVDRDSFSLLSMGVGGE